MKRKIKIEDEKKKYSSSLRALLGVSLLVGVAVTLGNLAKTASLEGGKTSSAEVLQDSPAALQEEHQRRLLVQRQNRFKPLENPYPHLQRLSNVLKLDDQVGGVIIFLHIPLTGGWLLRNSFLQQYTALTIVRKGASHDWQSEVDRFLTGGYNSTQGRVWTFELIGAQVPSFVDLVPQLRRWKQLAQRHNVPLLYMTLLSHPITYQLTAFDHYYLGVTAPGAERKRKKMDNMDSVSEFLATLLHNPQCVYLSRGGGYWGLLDGYQRHAGALAEFNTGVSKFECDRTYRLLLELMDWIGTGETLDVRDSIRLLSQWMGGVGAASLSPPKPAKRLMLLNRLSGPGELPTLAASVAVDQSWFEAARMVFKKKLLSASPAIN